MGNCPGGELSWWGIVLVRNGRGGEFVLVRKLSWWGVVLVRNCPGEELSW